MSSRQQLHAGIIELGLKLSVETEDKLFAYLALMAKWNRTYNLTAVRDEALMVSNHLLDSLVLMPHLIDVESLADVGSGAGLPGVPLALANPALAVTLVESSQKKASFLQQAKIELKLDNVSIHCGRVEALKTVLPFDAVVSRAFSDLAEFVRLAGHLLASGGRLLAMKGAHPDVEISQLPAGWRVTQSIPLAVPGLAAERHLIVIERV